MNAHTQRRARNLGAGLLFALSTAACTPAVFQQAEVEMPKRDPQTGEVVRDAKGNPVMERVATNFFKSDAVMGTQDRCLSDGATRNPDGTIAGVNLVSCYPGQSATNDTIKTGLTAAATLANVGYTVAVVKQAFNPATTTTTGSTSGSAGANVAVQITSAAGQITGSKTTTTDCGCSPVPSRTGPGSAVVTTGAINGYAAINQTFGSPTIVAVPSP